MDQSLKKTLHKIWDKYQVYDEKFIRKFLTGYKELDSIELRNEFRNWFGGDDAVFNKVEEFLSKPKHARVGGYDFDYKPINWDINVSNNHDMWVELDSSVVDANGKVTLDGYDGNTYDIGEVMDGEEFSGEDNIPWEVDDEINDIIRLQLKDLLMKNFGIDLVYYNNLVYDDQAFEKSLKESIRRILREEDFIPLEDLNTVIKDYEGGFDVFIMNGDKKIGEISFIEEDNPNQYTISDATIDDEYKGNRIYPKTIISLFKQKPNIIINSVFRSPEAQKAWIYLLSNLPPNIGKSVKYYKDEDTTLFQLKSRNLQESLRTILREESRFDKMGEERYKSCSMSDITRMEIIDNFLKEVETNSKYNKEEPNYDMLLDDWDGYDDQVYIQNQLDEGRIIFYEGWVDSCWSAVYKKPQYEGMDEEEVIDSIITKRFPRIAEEFNMVIDDYGYFNNGDGYIMYIVLKESNTNLQENIQRIREMMGLITEGLHETSWENVDEISNELDEYSRTLKNARKQGSGLRFPKTAIKYNPLRFRPYSREKLDIQKEEQTEGLHDTSWENNEGDKITLMDLLNATENIPVKKVSVKELIPHLLSWDGDEEEIKKIEKSDLKYPILIFVDDDGKFISIIDGHHRAQKAVRQGLETIKAKIIPINSLPKNIRKVFGHMGKQEQTEGKIVTEDPHDNNVIGYWDN